MVHGPWFIKNGYMHLFYAPDTSGEYVSLPPEEARHAVQSLRLGVGETVHLTNGQGMRYVAGIHEISKKECTLRIVDEEAIPRERPYQIHLAVAPTKNINRMEWLVEKATELGVETIWPILTFHSERRKLRLDRLERIAIAAMKQSQRSWLPRLKEPIAFGAFLDEDFGESQKILAYIDDLVQSDLVHTCQAGADVVLGIGPEGGFSAEEAEQARAKKYQLVSLGTHRLRTETAALSALATVHFVNNFSTDKG